MCEAVGTHLNVHCACWSQIRGLSASSAELQTEGGWAFNGLACVARAPKHVKKKMRLDGSEIGKPEQASETALFLGERHAKLFPTG